MMFAKLKNTFLSYDAKIRNARATKAVLDFLVSSQGICSLVLLTAAVYVFRIHLHPGYHGDEMSLLMLPYRWATYGDMSYPLIFGDSYNSGDMRFYPPVMAMLLRSFFHQLVGFSDVLSRLFSAGLMFAAAVGLALLVWRNAAVKTRGLGFLALFVIVLNPAFLVMARTVRFEQEVYFLGIVSFLSVLLLARPDEKLKSVLLWLLAGLCAAWAGMSHPWGLVFPFVMGLSFLFCHKAWRERDGLNFFTRGFLFALGCVWPIALTALQVFQNWPEFLQFMADTKIYYADRVVQLTNYYFNRHNIPLPPDMLGGRYLANILELHAYGNPAIATKKAGITTFPVGFLFQFLFWVFIVALAGSAKWMWQQRQNAKLLPVTLMLLLTLGFIVFGLYYVPNQTYFIYAGTLVPAVALLLYSAVPEQKPWLEKPLQWYAALSALFTVIYTVFLLFGISEKDVVSLDKRHAAMTEMEQTLDLVDENRDGVVLVDSATWIAGGKDVMGYLDVLRSAKAPAVKGMVIDPNIFHGYSHLFGKEDGELDWKDIWLTLTQENLLRGMVVVQKPYRDAYYFMGQMKALDPVYISIFEKNGDLTKWKAYLDMQYTGKTMREGRYLFWGFAGAEIPFDDLSLEKGNRWIYKKHTKNFIQTGILDVTTPQDFDYGATERRFYILPLQPAQESN